MEVLTDNITAMWNCHMQDGGGVLDPVPTGLAPLEVVGLLRDLSSGEPFGGIFKHQGRQTRPQEPSTS